METRKKICSKICREEKILAFLRFWCSSRQHCVAVAQTKTYLWWWWYYTWSADPFREGKQQQQRWTEFTNCTLFVWLTNDSFCSRDHHFHDVFFCSSRTGRNTLQTAGRCVYVLRSVTGRIQWAMCITTDEIFKLLSYYRTIFFQAFRVIFVSYSCDVFHYAHDLKCHPVAFFSLSPESLLFVKLVKLSIKKTNIMAQFRRIK